MIIENYCRENIVQRHKWLADYILCCIKAVDWQLELDFNALTRLRNS